jgi:hypothetical protein
MQYAWFDLTFVWILDRRANMVLEIRRYLLLMLFFSLHFIAISVCAGANERFIFYLLQFVRNVDYLS